MRSCGAPSTGGATRAVVVDGARVRRLHRRHGPRPASGRRRTRRPGGVRCRDRPSCRSTSQRRARASASRAARIARWALCSRDRTVPGGMPRISAISAWGVAREVVQREHDALVGRQAPEPAFELVPVGDREVFVGRGPVRRSAAPGGWPRAPFPARLADADVDQEPLEPRVEPVRIAECPQVTPGDHQRILEGILGPIDVAEDPLCDREQPIGTGTDQVDIRLPVAALSRLDEIAIHLHRPWSRSAGRRSAHIGGRCGDRVNLPRTDHCRTGFRRLVPRPEAARPVRAFRNREAGTLPEERPRRARGGCQDCGQPGLGLSIRSTVVPTGTRYVA